MSRPPTNKPREAEPCTRPSNQPREAKPFYAAVRSKTSRQTFSANSAISLCSSRNSRPCAPMRRCSRRSRRCAGAARRRDSRPGRIGWKRRDCWSVVKSLRADDDERPTLAPIVNPDPQKTHCFPSVPVGCGLASGTPPPLAFNLPFERAALRVASARDLCVLATPNDLLVNDGDAAFAPTC